MSTITQFTSGKTQYRIEFDYLARTFVVVTLVNSSNPTLNRVLEVGRDYRFLNPTMIEILVDQSGFDIVRIHRQTGTDLVVDFRNGSVLTASDLTNAELQAIHIAEEGRDQTVDLAKEYADAAGSSAGNAKDSEDEARRIADNIKASGQISYITRRSFEKGFNITTWNEVLLWEEDGEYYRWDGTLPKNVPAGSTPEASGGVGIGAWVGVGDASLRAALASSGDGKGDMLVATKQPVVGSVGRTVNNKLLEVLSVKDFGAIGDGVLHKLSERFTTLAEAKAVYPFVTSLDQSIDYAAVQQAVITAIASKRRLGVPEGNYFCSDPITITVENHYSKSGLNMYGEGRAQSLLTFPNGSDGIRIRPATPGEYTYNVSLRDFDIVQDGHLSSIIGTVGYGIHATNGCSQMLWHNLRFEGFGTMIKFDDAVFLSRFTALHSSLCGNGFIMGTMGTTNFIDNIFVYGSTGVAYKLTCVYSSIGSLACDRCYGVPYDFVDFSGSVGSLGWESAKADTVGPIVRFTRTRADIGTVYGFDLASSPGFNHYFQFGASSVNISKVLLENLGGVPANLNSRFYTSFQSQVRFVDIKSDFTFSFSEPSIDSDLSDSFVEFDGVKQTHGGVRPYIGSFGDTGQQIAQNFKDYTPPAFLFDCFGGFTRAGASGQKDMTYAKGPRLGMWGIERRPDVHGTAAYVSLTDATDNGSAQYAVVPAILYGRGRPADPVTGTHWSDPNSKKVFYYAYGQWQDYMGNVLP